MSSSDIAEFRTKETEHLQFNTLPEAVLPAPPWDANGPPTAMHLRIWAKTRGLSLGKAHLKSELSAICKKAWEAEQRALEKGDDVYVVDPYNRVSLSILLSRDSDTFLCFRTHLERQSNIHKAIDASKWDSRNFTELGAELPKLPFSVIRNYWKDQASVDEQRPYDCRVMTMAWKGIVGLTEIQDFKYNPGNSQDDIRHIYVMWKCRASFASRKYDLLMCLQANFEENDIWSIEWAICGCTTGTSAKCHHVASLALIIMLFPRVVQGRSERPSPTAQLCWWIQRRAVVDRRLVITPLRVLESSSVRKFGEKGKGVSKGKEISDSTRSIAKEGHFNTDNRVLEPEVLSACCAYYELADYVVSAQKVLADSKSGSRKRRRESGVSGTCDGGGESAQGGLKRSDAGGRPNRTRRVQSSAATGEEGGTRSSPRLARQPSSLHGDRPQASNSRGKEPASQQGTQPPPPKQGCLYGTMCRHKSEGLSLHTCDACTFSRHHMCASELDDIDMQCPVCAGGTRLCTK